MNYRMRKDISTEDVIPTIRATSCNCGQTYLISAVYVMYVRLVMIQIS